MALKHPCAEVVFSRVGPHEQSCGPSGEISEAVPRSTHVGPEGTAETRLLLLTHPVTPGQQPIHQAFAHPEVTAGPYTTWALFWVWGDIRGEHKVSASVDFRRLCGENRQRDINQKSTWEGGVKYGKFT